MQYKLLLSMDVDLAWLKVHMCWLKLLEGTTRPNHQQHHKLKDRPWFTGILTRNKENRIRIRVWRVLCYQKSGRELHTISVFVQHPQVTSARVYGYGLTFGLT